MVRISAPFAILTSLAAATLPTVSAGPIAYGICQTGCNTVAVACYAAAGFQFGTVVAAVGAPATILACNAALGTSFDTPGTNLSARDVATYRVQLNLGFLTTSTRSTPSHLW